MSVVFPKFYLDSRRRGRLIEIGARDYVLAGVFASLYVLARTSPKTFLKAFLINLLVIALGVLAVVASSLLPGAFAAIASVAVVAILVIEQSRMMVRCVVQHYMDHGWDMTPG